MGTLNFGALVILHFLISANNVLERYAKVGKRNLVDIIANLKMT